MGKTEKFKKVDDTVLTVDRLTESFTTADGRMIQGRIIREEVEKEVNLGSLKKPSNIVKFKYKIPMSDEQKEKRAF